MSAGHSGSTLLDILAGTIPGVFSTGELTYLPWQIARAEQAGPEASPQKLCSCGLGFRECNVWSQVVSVLGDKKGFNIYDDPFRFKINLLQNERYVPRRWERVQRGLFSFALQHRSLNMVTRAWHLHLRDAIANNWLLFDAVKEVSGADCIADSSKSIHRLYHLYLYRPEDVYGIMLMRNVRAIAYSELKRGGDPVRSARGWVRQHNRMVPVLQQLKDLKLLPIRYESLASDPAETRRRIAGFLGLPDPGETICINTRAQHLVAGNATRHTGNMQIKLDDAWREGLSAEMREQIDKIEQGLDRAWKGIFSSVDLN